CDRRGGHPAGASRDDLVEQGGRARRHRARQSDRARHARLRSRRCRARRRQRGRAMNPEELREIMRLMESSSFDELVLETKGVKLVLRRGEAGVERFDGEAPPAKRAQTPSPQLVAPKNPAKKTAAAPSAAPAGCIDVTAPFLGVFYAAPKPGADPFVKVG